MHRERIEARIGNVVDSGWARLLDYAHEFNKRGDDGSARGNIAERRGAVVHGVLYQLAPHQKPALEKFEGGYHVRGVRVLHAARVVEAITFVARTDMVASGLKPHEDYLSHYQLGMIEHKLPWRYREQIINAAR